MHVLFALFRVANFLFLVAANRPRLELFEEVMALVVNKNESREVFHANLPHGFHAQFRVLYALNALDAALRKHGRNTANRAQIEATNAFGMLLPLY